MLPPLLLPNKWESDLLLIFLYFSFTFVKLAKWLVSGETLLPREQIRRFASYLSPPSNKQLPSLPALPSLCRHSRTPPDNQLAACLSHACYQNWSLIWWCCWFTVYQLTEESEVREMSFRAASCCVSTVVAVCLPVVVVMSERQNERIRSRFWIEIQRCFCLVSKWRRGRGRWR